MTGTFDGKQIRTFVDGTEIGATLETPAGTAIEYARASRTQIRAKRRVAVTVRAAGSRGPLRRVRLSVRRADGRKVIASPRTNAKGSVRVVLRIPTSGRLRVGVVGRSGCTPAFITVSKSLQPAG